MFTNLRDKIQNVHSLPTGLLEVSKLPKIVEKKVPRDLGVNLEAGYSLLSWNRSKWEKLHSQSEENAQLADQIAEQIDKLESRSSHHINAIKCFISECEKISAVEREVNFVLKDLVNLKSNIVHLEKVLDELYSRKELEKFVYSQAEENYKLFQYRMQKEKELESFKNELAEQHNKKIEEFEKIYLLKCKEKQKIYQDAFEEEVQLYRLYGEVIKKAEFSEEHQDDCEKSANILVKPLEDIEIEPDEEDQKALDSFLGISRGDRAKSI